MGSVHTLPQPEEELFMSDQASRIEKMILTQSEKIDYLSQLLHTELGAAPLRQAAVKDLQRRVHGLQRTVDKNMGAIRLGKWLIGILLSGNLVAGIKLLGLW